MTIHVLTVHWQSEKWLDIQRRYLAANLPDDSLLYASLNGIDPARFATYHYAADLPGSHADKLDALAGTAAETADPDDLLLFIDGDAFPIVPLDAGLLEGRDLAAARRDENFETYPHPCVALCRVGFWRDLGGSWQPGPIVPNRLGEPVTDVGCTLAEQLRDAGIEWTPLLRTNHVDLHPVWYAVYADRVYHHGAGFRLRATRADVAKPANARAAAWTSRTPEWVPVVHRAERAIRYRAARRRRADLERRIHERGAALEHEVFEAIEQDPKFWRRFTGEPDRA